MSRSNRTRLSVNELEERAVPANNLTIVASNVPDSSIHIQRTGPTTTIRTSGSNAQLSLATLQDELSDPGTTEVIVTTDVRGNGNDGNQIANITWDATVAGHLDFTGLGTGKILTFQTVADTNAVGDIRLIAVSFDNGAGSEQISLNFDSSATNGDVEFLANGPATTTVTYQADSVRDLTVTAGSGDFNFTDNGVVPSTADAGGLVAIGADDVSIGHQLGLTSGRAMTVAALGALSLSSGTDLSALGDLTLTAGTTIDMSNATMSASGGRIAVSGSAVTIDDVGITAPLGIELNGATSVTLTSGSFAIQGDLAISGGDINLIDAFLPGAGTVDSVNLSGQTVQLVSSKITAANAVAITGATIAMTNSQLAAGKALTMAGSVSVAGNVQIQAAGVMSIAGAINGFANLELLGGSSINLAQDIGALAALNSFALLQGDAKLSGDDLNAAQVTVGQVANPELATLGFGGDVAGNLTVRESGRLAPGGNGVVGLLNVTGNLALDGTLAVDFGSGGTADLVNVGGNVTIGAAGMLGNGLGSGSLSGPFAKIIDYTGTLTGEFANAPPGIPVLVGADVVTINSYAPDVFVFPYTAGVGTTIVGVESGTNDSTGFKAVLTGGGQLVSGVDYQNRSFLVARNTTSASRLTITTIVNGSDDIVTFPAGILISGPLANFSARKVNVGMQLRASGAVVAAKFRDFLSDPASSGIEFGGTPGQLTTINARSLLGSVRTGSTIALLKTTQALGAQVNVPGMPDSIIAAPAIRSLSAGWAAANILTPGRINSLKVLGDYVGDVTAQSIGAASVRSATGDWTSTATLDSFKSTAASSIEIAAGSITKFEAGSGSSAYLQSNGKIGSITGKGELGMLLELSATQVGPIVVAGPLKGDGLDDGADWKVDNGMTKISCAKLLDVDIAAKYVGTLAASGSTLFGLSGDIERTQLILTGNDGTTAQYGLKSVVVKGNVFYSRFDVLAGNVGAVTVGRFHNSQLYVGYFPDAGGNFLLGSFAQPKFKLTSFRTTALPTVDPNHPLQWAFQDSEIAADTIGTVTLSGLNTDGANSAFGIKVRSNGAIVKVLAADPDFPANLLGTNLNANPNPIADDFYFLNV